MYGIEVGGVLISTCNIDYKCTYFLVLSMPPWLPCMFGTKVLHASLTHRPASKYLHLTTFSNIYVILSMFLYL